jgi:hypothetical protein
LSKSFAFGFGVAATVSLLREKEEIEKSNKFHINF